MKGKNASVAADERPSAQRKSGYAFCPGRAT
jgi:hypothetical protein